MKSNGELVNGNFDTLADKMRSRHSHILNIRSHVDNVNFQNMSTIAILNFKITKS